MFRIPAQVFLRKLGALDEVVTLVKLADYDHENDFEIPFPIPCLESTILGMLIMAHGYKCGILKPLAP